VTLFEPSREWFAVRAIEVLPGDVLIRRGRRGPSVQSITRMPDGWMIVNYAEGRGSSPPMRRITPMVVERLSASVAA